MLGAGRTARPAFFTEAETEKGFTMKPEEYKEKDAVKVKCLRKYEVKDGTDDPVTFEEGKSYSVSPRSQAHLLRQTYNTYAQTEEDKRGGRRGRYTGVAPFFVDPVAVAEQEAAEKAAEAEAKKAEAAAAKAAKAK